MDDATRAKAEKVRQRRIADDAAEIARRSEIRKRVFADRDDTDHIVRRGERKPPID